ncbi:hypothetical protein GPECTOR_83g281 [Gonium pectorale]|uniref:Protein kinase domain-containing protein n=1 Tax=Gonium pectorale TaxID=33097 RepID=A0A150G1C0_GONPE|nr:hypothetical protein GPECTOR_83g281 [Gonium pectorale]|eukprot:KXZ43669.1 hypothetical protein GPECTOR_83g281 [Gonium pectorale]
MSPSSLLLSALPTPDRAGDGAAGTAAAGGTQPGSSAPALLRVTVTGELGRGAQGVVYRGTWRGLPVAIKNVLFQHHPRLGGGGGSGPDPRAARALAEAAISASLSHPNIVATYTYMLQPLRDADPWVSGPGGRGGGALLTIPSPVASSTSPFAVSSASGGAGLDGTESRPPASPSAPCDYVAKVGDFGLSGRLDPDTSATHLSGPARRSSAYSAPELVRHGRAGPAGDAYAFGVVLWERALGLPLPAALARPEGAALRAWLAEQAAAAPDEAGAVPQGQQIS